MTLTYGFYDSSSGDRTYNALQFGSIFDGIIEDGVYANIGNSLMVAADTGMNVNVQSGRAWFNHTWTYNDADVSITLSTAHATLDRIDVIYLEINEGSGVRANSVNKLTGTPASTPVAPTLTNTSTVHQYPLAHIYVSAGVTTIYQADITNKVGFTETPFVTGPLASISSEDLVVQWEAEFMAWFDDMKDQLSVDAAGNLQLQIDALEDDLAAQTHIGGDGALIATDALAASAVTAAKLAAGAVTSSKLGAGAVTQDKIANEAVGTVQLGPYAVTSAKIANYAIGMNQLSSQVAGNGLLGGSGSQLYINTDDTTLYVDNDVLKIKARTRRIWVPAGMLVESGSVAGGSINGVYNAGLWYNAAGYLASSIVIPENLGTNPTFKVYWYSPTSGAARLSADYFVVGDTDSIPGTSTVAVTATNPGANKISLDSLGTLSGSFQQGDILSFLLTRLYGHAGDTLDSAMVYVLGVLIEYSSTL